MTVTTTNPLHRLSPEAIEELGNEFQAIHDEVDGGPGRARRRLHPEHDRVPPAARRHVTDRADGLALPARVAARHRRTVGGEDPREHGDRPQRPARPVGLDERPEHPLVHLGLGHRLARVGLEALPQLPAPHVHQRDRQGPRPGLRHHAHRPQAALAPDLPAAADLQPAADGPVRVGRCGARPRLRGHPQGEEAEGAAARRAARDRPEGAPPDREGLHRLPAPQRPGVEEDGLRESHGELRPQPVVPRDHLLRPLPGPGVHVQRGGHGGRDARRAGMSGSCSARRTSRAARPST